MNPEIDTVKEEIPPEEIKAHRWNDTVQFMKLNLRVWQLVLVMLLALAIIAAIGFGINAFLNYQITANNNRLAEDWMRAKSEQLELQKITSESLGAFKAAREILAVEIEKREQAELILQKDELNTNEKLKSYEKAKRNIVVNNADASFGALLERAKRLGITPK